MKLPGILTILVLTLSSFAFEDLGPLVAVRKEQPELLVPGRVFSIEIKNVPCYIFAGQAEQCFTGEFAEADSELYEEAAIAAKKLFYESFTKKGFKTEVTMSNCSVLYRFNEKKVYTVVLFVPQKDVVVKRQPFEAADKSPEKTSPPNAGAKAVSSSASAVVETPATGNAETPKNPAPVESVAKPHERANGDTDLTDKKIARLEARIAADPDEALNYIRLGKLLLKKGDDEKAISTFKTAISCAERAQFFDENERVDLIFSTAELCEKRKDYQAAIKYYRLLLKHKCSADLRRKAVAGISRLRLQTH